MLGVGDPLPGTSVVRPDGASVALRDDLVGEASLLVFLRHLGWLPCREHLGEVAEAKERLGRRVAVVTFADAPLLARFEAGLGLTGLDLYGDPDRRAYAALGFGRASGARVWLDPRVWQRYVGLLARGRTPRLPQGQDTLQLGGDVLADAQGRIEWIHRSAGPEDRPSVAELEQRRR